MIFILASNEDSHTISDDFKIGQDRITSVESATFGSHRSLEFKWELCCSYFRVSIFDSKFFVLHISRACNIAWTSLKFCQILYEVNCQWTSKIDFSIFSSPEPKAHRWAFSIPMLRRPSSVHNFKHLLLRNRLANQNQILCGASLGRGNESLFAASRSHDQDGRHAHIW